MAIYLKITNPTEVVKKKTSKWLTDITPERIDRKLVEDEVIKGIIEQLALEGIEGEISAISGFEIKSGLFLMIEKLFLLIRTKLTSAIVRTFLFLLMNFEWIFIFGLLLILNIVSIVILSPRNKGEIYFIEVSIKGNSKPFFVRST